MKVSLLTENLVSFLPLINKVLPSHSQIPILSNILLIANPHGFFVKVTDLELGAEIKVPAKIEKEGAITVPGKEFLEAINSLPHDKITLELNKDVLILKCRENTISFNTIPRDEFPQLFKQKGEMVAQFERVEFYDIFSYLTFSVSQEETRPQLTGIYIDVKGGGINFVATDGYRMSVKKVSAGKSFSESIIVSVKLINEALSSKNTEQIRLYLNKEENQAIIEFGDVVLVGRMIGGAFPDYEKAIPKESKTVVEFEREELLQNVRLASVFARESSNILTMEIIGNSMRLFTKTQGVGEGESVISCKKKGEDGRIAFNVKYLSELLKTVNGKTLILKLNSPTEPALFEIKEKNFLHVIMPIQVEE